MDTDTSTGKRKAEELTPPEDCDLLNVEWGDLDPAFVEQLRQDETSSKACIQLLQGSEKAKALSFVGGE